MYDIDPKAVFAHERVFENPRAVARMRRMLGAMGIEEKDVPVVGMRDVDRILEVAGATDDVAGERVLAGGHGRVRQGVLKLENDPVIVFNTFVWDPAQRAEALRQYAHPVGRRLAHLFGGAGTEFAYSPRELLTPDRDEFVCQGGWGIHTIAGCLHKCDYCGQGYVVNLMLDLEDFCVQLEKMFAERPQQKLYRYDLFSDILAFDPEYGAAEVVGECFDRTDDKYLLLYTRSNNVQHLVDLPYKTHTLANWTLSMETVCREIERDSPSLDERIEAMRICQDAGYVVRAGFSPIIPIADWRRETTDMLERLFARVKPDVLRCWVLAMMEADEFERIFDASQMDPKFMRRMREEAHALKGLHGAPFPLDVRAEIYEYYLDEVQRISPETRVALCTEHPKLWDLLGHKTGMKRDDMYCCCGGLSVPASGR